MLTGDDDRRTRAICLPALGPASAQYSEKIAFVTAFIYGKIIDAFDNLELIACRLS